MSSSTYRYKRVRHYNEPLPYTGPRLCGCCCRFSCLADSCGSTRIRRRVGVGSMLIPDMYACIGPRNRQKARSCLQYSLLGVMLFVILLWLGMEFQERTVSQADDTLPFYTTPRVCGIALDKLSDEKDIMVAEDSTGSADEASSSFLAIQTFDSKETALDSKSSSGDEFFVGHCGDCGACSNPHDISIYDDTQNTLFDTSKKCAAKALMWGRKTAGTCLEENVGFTSNCNECWLENIMCDLRQCLLVCTWHGIFGHVDNSNSDQHELNRCTLCDEKKCGPAFLKCAGANRRRSGIVSDIERDVNQEVCHSVERDNWWKEDELQRAFEKTLMIEESEQAEQESTKKPNEWHSI